MAGLGVMIEAQEGLTWDLWRQIVLDSEEFGFASLRTSDHLQSVMGAVDRVSVPAWPALTLAAEITRRIQLGPMVSPMTFYRPAVLARMARAVDELSGGRLILGVGAGWNVEEHEAFEIPLPEWGERFDDLERGLDVIMRTLAAGSLPILVGGGGEQRSLPLAARRAVEWNLVDAEPATFATKSRRLDGLCRAIGRDPATLARSVMAAHLIGRDESELLGRAERMAAFLPKLAGKSPPEALDALRADRRRWLVGTPSEVVERLRPLAAAGASLFHFQHYLLDDRDALGLLMEEVAPAVAAF